MKLEGSDLMTGGILPCIRLDEVTNLPRLVDEDIRCLVSQLLARDSFWQDVRCEDGQVSDLAPQDIFLDWRGRMSLVHSEPGSPASLDGSIHPPPLWPSLREKQASNDCWCSRSSLRPRLSIPYSEYSSASLASMASSSASTTSIEADEPSTPTGDAGMMRRESCIRRRSSVWLPRRRSSVDHVLHDLMCKRDPLGQLTERPESITSTLRDLSVWEGTQDPEGGGSHMGILSISPDEPREGSKDPREMNIFSDPNSEQNICTRVPPQTRNLSMDSTVSESVLTNLLSQLGISCDEDLDQDDEEEEDIDEDLSHQSSTGWLNHAYGSDQVHPPSHRGHHSAACGHRISMDMSNHSWRVDEIVVEGKVEGSEYGPFFSKDFYNIRNLKTGERASMKIVWKVMMRSQSHGWKNIMHERLVWQKLTGCNRVLPLKSFMETEATYCFITSSIKSLFTMSHIISSAAPLATDAIRILTGQVAVALDSIHKKGVLLRGLKPEDILVSTNGQVVIGNFSRAKIGHSSRKSISPPCMYWSPEMVRGESYRKDGDWWGFGMMLFQLVFGTDPVTVFRERIRRLSSSSVSKSPSKESSSSEDKDKPECDVGSHLLVEVYQEIPLILSKSQAPKETRLLMQHLFEGDGMGLHRLGYHTEDLAKLQRESFYRGINWRKLMESDS